MLGTVLAHATTGAWSFTTGVRSDAAHSLTATATDKAGKRIRKALALDAVPGGVSANNNDAMIYDVDANGMSKSGWGHPGCGGTEADVAASLGAGIK